MAEREIQLARLLKSPHIRPQLAYVGEILTQRFEEFQDYWKYGLLQQEGSVATSTQTPILDVNNLAGTFDYTVVPTHILIHRTGSSTFTPVVSFGTESATYVNWHAGIDLSALAQGEWGIIYPYPDSDGYGNDLPAGAIHHLDSTDLNHDQLYVKLQSGTWSASCDIYTFGFAIRSDL